MTGDAYELKVKHAKTDEWISIGSYWQTEYSVERDANFYESLGLETKTRQFKTEYADEG